MEINVSQPWLRCLQKGIKTVEGRLNKGKFADLRPGSVIIVAGDSRSNSRKRRRTVHVVSKVIRYASFEEFLSQEGLARTLPGVATIKEGVTVYRQFYSAEAEKEHGVLAIHVVMSQ